MAKRANSGTFFVCGNCPKKFKSIPGHCKKCGSPTRYASFKYCSNCAKKANVCQVCLSPRGGAHE